MNSEQEKEENRDAIRRENDNRKPKSKASLISVCLLKVQLICDAMEGDC